MDPSKEAGGTSNYLEITEISYAELNIGRPNFF